MTPSRTDFISVDFSPARLMPERDNQWGSWSCRKWSQLELKHSLTTSSSCHSSCPSSVHIGRRQFHPDPLQEFNYAESWPLTLQCLPSLSPMDVGCTSQCELDVAGLIARRSGPDEQEVGGRARSKLGSVFLRYQTVPSIGPTLKGRLYDQLKRVGSKVNWDQSGTMIRR